MKLATRADGRPPAEPKGCLRASSRPRNDCSLSAGKRVDRAFSPAGRGRERGLLQSPSTLAVTTAENVKPLLPPGQSRGISRGIRFSKMKSAAHLDAPTRARRATSSSRPEGSRADYPAGKRFYLEPDPPRRHHIPCAGYQGAQDAGCGLASSSGPGHRPFTYPRCNKQT